MEYNDLNSHNANFDEIKMANEILLFNALANCIYINTLFFYLTLDCESVYCLPGSKVTVWKVRKSHPNCDTDNQIKIKKK